MDPTTIPIEQLQQDVRATVEEALHLVRASGEALAASTAGREKTRFTKYESRLEQELKNVDSLELRIAVVAPMKAGKSTIINAVVGRDILPSRSAAMTAIPTEVAVTPSIRAPRLTFSRKLLDAIHHCEDALREHVRQQEWGSIQSALAVHPDSIRVAERLLKDDEPLLEGPIEEPQRIWDALLWVNDLNRLAAVLVPEAGITSRIPATEIARIEAPLSMLARDAMRAGNGRLVLIDTPGPDEWENNAFLQSVVQAQLDHCSGVLLVLNYTTLNNSAAGDLKKKVMETAQLTSVDNLLVVVNRIDQRKSDHDLSVQQVREFVGSHLGVAIDVESAVFETSAAWAFAAAHFLGERERRPSATLEELSPVVDPVLKELYPLEWESMKNEVPLDKLVERGQRLWAKSGFDRFLERAIARFASSAGEVCLRTALGVTTDVLRRVLQELELRAGALQSDSAALQKAINKLERDADALRKQRDTLQGNVRKKKKQLDDDLHAFLVALRKASKLAESDLTGGAESANPPFLPKRLIDKYLRKKKSLVFTSEKQALEAIDSAVLHGQQKITGALLLSQKELLRVIRERRDDIHQEAVAKAKPIVERAAEELGKGLAIRLELPEYEPPRIRLPEVTFDPDAVEITVPGKTRTVRVQKRVWWTLFLWNRWVEETVVDPATKATEYHVDLGRVAEAINASCGEMMRALESELKDFTHEQLGKSLDDYLAALQDVVEGFVGSLQSAKEQHRLGFEQQKAIGVALKDLTTRAAALHARCTELAAAMPRSAQRKVA